MLVAGILMVEKKIILEDKHKNPIAVGTKIENNLYKMKLKSRILCNKWINENIESLQTFTLIHPTQSWETWHKWYGHVGYSGLQKLLDHKMVDGLNSWNKYIKTRFRNMYTSETNNKIIWQYFKQKFEPRRTHTYWSLGRYEKQSIHGNQYYILIVDNATRYVTVHFLKGKDEAAKKQVQNYLTYLKTQQKSPKAIRIDRGSEFLNPNLKSWFSENGLISNNRTLFTITEWSSWEDE